jgi:hypothetical protein
VTREKQEVRPVAIQIVELDERLDMTLDPLAVSVDINAKCSTDSGCNRQAGCGRPAPQQS